MVEGYSLVDLELVVVAEKSGLLDITLDRIIGARSDLQVTPPSLSDLSLLSGPEGAGLLLGFPDGSLTRLDCAEFE